MIWEVTNKMKKNCNRLPHVEQVTGDKRIDTLLEQSERMEPMNFPLYRKFQNEKT